MTEEGKRIPERMEVYSADGRLLARGWRRLMRRKIERLGLMGKEARYIVSEDGKTLYLIMTE